MEVLNTPAKLPLKKSFARAQIVSLMATSVDFTASLFIHHFLDVYYVTATTLGSVLGALTSFNLGRKWAFVSKTGKIKKQLPKFIIINLFSVFANTTGVFFFKETFDLPFIVSRILVAIIVGVGFNFVMNRYFVFK